MNPHKESWQQQVGIVPKRSKNHVAKRFMHMRKGMFSGHSDKTKWERIGYPLFVETPLTLFMVLNPYTRIGSKAAALAKKIEFEQNIHKPSQRRNGMESEIECPYCKSKEVDNYLVIDQGITHCICYECGKEWVE